MKWMLIIGALLLFSLFGHDVVLGIFATVIIACIFVMLRMLKKKKQQKAEAEEQARAQLDADREAFEKEREIWKKEKEAKACKNEHIITPYSVRGIFAHEDEIFHNLMAYNSEYDYSKADMIDFCVPDTPIYKWIPKDLPAVLVPEPDNKYDPNAIRIEVGGILIGYIPKESCKKILEDMDAGRIVNVAFYATGGAYKTLVEDYDLLTDKSKYTVETGRAELSAEVYVKVRAN